MIFFHPCLRHTLWGMNLLYLLHRIATEDVIVHPRLAPALLSGLPCVCVFFKDHVLTVKYTSFWGTPNFYRNVPLCSSNVQLCLFSWQ